MPDSVVLTRKRELVTQTFQHTNRIEPRRGFKITEKEINGLLNPWKNIVDNRDLGKDFRDWLLEVQLKGALQVVCWMKSLHGKYLSPG